jgi:cytochrome P450
MNYPPGPSSFWKIIKLLIKRQIDPIGFYESMFKEYGNLVYIKTGKHNFLLLNDADAIEQVLQTEAKLYKKSTAYERFRLIFGNGLLTSEGEIWKKQRRMMAGAFTVKNIEKLYPLINQETEKMISHWKDGDELDLAEEMNGLTLQIISRTMLGELKDEEKKLLRTSVQEMLKYLQTSRHLWLQLFLLLFPIKDRIAFSIKLESKLPLKSTRTFFKSIDSIR